MGGFMQPQGHLQLTVNLIARGLDPQTAIDELRFCITDGTREGKALLEVGLSNDTISELISMGHNVKPDVTGPERVAFGNAQVIKRDRATGVLWAGSDGRCDGCAMGY
jgi:gamma-glutamyltranspeptidase/glutathione hydrolase